MNKEIANSIDQPPHSTEGGKKTNDNIIVKTEKKMIVTNLMVKQRKGGKGMKRALAKPNCGKGCLSSLVKQIF